ncbi:MAG TPA: L,D-transpeptidase family protein [Sphingomicrobium sp.]|nr:L,D-transpeptidase family protein [Sphingomicrobium sp.]
MRTRRAGPRPARHLPRLNGAVAVALIAAAPFALPAGQAQAETLSASADVNGREVAAFYASRQQRPLWLQGGQLSPAGHELVRLLNSADVDRLDSRSYMTSALMRALGGAARGDRRAIVRAEQLLSEAFVAYARDLRRAPYAGMTYVDAALRPAAPAPRALLGEAAAAPSLTEYVQNMGWMNPLYAPLRRALSTNNFADSRERTLLQLNLERARALPASKGRFVLVNAAAQKLFMYENGQVVDSMRVVVGKPKYATPMMTALIKFASLNPYWNVPPDLAAERIAPGVVKEGIRHLTARGYQVLSSWEEDAHVIDPTTVDWQAVADGRVEVRVRQLPGPGNAMGQMKFMFPNQFGVYLHDTPEKELLSEASRLYSGGCVRLEDAPRLARWLFGQDLRASSDQPELPVPLPGPVPVAITYLTAVPSGSSIVYFEDIYGRDAQRMAQLGGGALAASW